MFSGNTQLSGKLTTKVTRSSKPRRVWLWKVKQFLRYGWRELPLFATVLALPVAQGLIPGLNVCHSAVYAKVIRSNGTVEDLGLVGQHLVTTAGKTFLAGCMDNTNEPETLKYHGFGTGTTAAASGDTALQTEMTTAYATNSTRITGSQATSTNTYTTIATVTPDAAVAITEWGLFNNATVGSGTLFDRQVFSAINLNGSGDSLQVTYVLTFS